jgi:RNA polymerase sigma factor (sigma-70 family)
LQEESDHSLMLQVGSGRTEALAVLFERHYRRLFSYFRRLGHGRTFSEDLVQDTFLRMLRYAGSFRASGSFLPWMYRIASHVAADNFGRTPVTVPDTEVALDELPGPERADPEGLQLAWEAEARLRRALAALPQEQRDLVLLSRVRGLALEDLATMFDCSAGALKVRLHRSLKALRERFEAGAA